jgi:hypothetical protein
MNPAPASYSYPAPWPPTIDSNAPYADYFGSRRQVHTSVQQAAIKRYGPPPESMWMVCGNIVVSHPYGPGGRERRTGLRLFKAGSKVTICKFWRNASPERVTVVGRHRKSNKYISVILETRFLGNLRVQLIKIPHIILQHWESPVQRHAYGRDMEAAAAVLVELLPYIGSEE